MQQKKVAIILINWNSYSLVAGCIASLGEMYYNDYDIIVVDNASADDSLKNIKAQFPDVIIIESSSNLGFAGGNNLGMQYAVKQDYPYLLLLNNDTFVQPDFLQILVTYMDEHPENGVIQPMICFAHDPHLLWNGGSYFNQWTGSTYTTTPDPQGSASNGIKNIDWVSGCAFFTRSDTLKQTGLFAEELFMYYEDVDLSFRIKKAGYGCVYQPRAVIFHIAGMATKTNSKGKEGFISPLIHYYNIRNRIWIAKKYTTALYIPTAFLYNLFYIAGVLGYFVIRGRFNKFKAVVRGTIDGLAGKLR